MPDDDGSECGSSSGSESANSGSDVDIDSGSEGDEDREVYVPSAEAPARPVRQRQGRRLWGSPG